MVKASRLHVIGSLDLRTNQRGGECPLRVPEPLAGGETRVTLQSGDWERYTVPVDTGIKHSLPVQVEGEVSESGICEKMAVQLLKLIVYKSDCHCLLQLLH